MLGLVHMFFFEFFFGFRVLLLGRFATLEALLGLDLFLLMWFGFFSWFLLISCLLRRSFNFLLLIILRFVLLLTFLISLLPLSLSISFYFLRLTFLYWFRWAGGLSLMLFLAHGLQYILKVSNLLLEAMNLWPLSHQVLIDLDGPCKFLLPFKDITQCQVGIDVILVKVKRFL